MGRWIGFFVHLPPAPIPFCHPTFTTRLTYPHYRILEPTGSSFIPRVTSRSFQRTVFSGQSFENMATRGGGKVFNTLSYFELQILPSFSFSQTALLYLCPWSKPLECQSERSVAASKGFPSPSQEVSSSHRNKRNCESHL